jgi:hypothetical protein
MEKCTKDVMWVRVMLLLVYLHFRNVHVLACTSKAGVATFVGPGFEKRTGTGSATGPVVQRSRPVCLMGPVSRLDHAMASGPLAASSLLDHAMASGPLAASAPRL